MDVPMWALVPIVVVAFPLGVLALAVPVAALVDAIRHPHDFEP
jgi:hypothetical protein